MSGQEDRKKGLNRRQLLGSTAAVAAAGAAGAGGAMTLSGGAVAPDHDRPTPPSATPVVLRKADA